jgi:pyruvate formate lyase activating enzyme
MDEGTIFNIQRYSIHDGPGIRTTVFLKGCPVHCWWCHNPESQGYGPQLILREDRCIGCGACMDICANNAVTLKNSLPYTDRDRCSCCGACARACPTCAREIIGETVSVEHVTGEIEKDIIFYDQSGGGATFSGGEPLAQPAFLRKLLKACRDRDIHTAVDTSGYANWEVIHSVAGSTELFLYDIKHLDDTMHTKTVGVSNRVILDNLQKLARIHGNIIIRMPLVPGINDDDENIVSTAQFISSVNIKEVNILPYHKTGMDKYGRLGREYRLTDTLEPSKELIDRIEGMFQKYGLNVKIGG